jgi:putative endonuclease
VQWYTANGFVVVDRNWRCRRGEIDLVARRGRTLVFCEVKTRSSVAFGSPAASVTMAKQRRIRVLAMQWLRDHPDVAGEIRFDVAAVMDGTVEVIEAAF